MKEYYSASEAVKTIDTYLETLGKVMEVLPEHTEDPKLGEHTMNLIIQGVPTDTIIRTLRSVFSGDDGVNF